MFKTLARKYPNTEMAQFVRGKCDQLRDYHVAPALPPHLCDDDYADL